jgi:hypothetical protein
MHQDKISYHVVFLLSSSGTISWRRRAKTWMASRNKMRYRKRILLNEAWDIVHIRYFINIYLVTLACANQQIVYVIQFFFLRKRLCNP